MSRWCHVAACSLAALVLAAPLPAQAPSEKNLLPFESGRIVRADVQLPGGPRVLEGALRRAGRDSLVVDRCTWVNTCGPVAVPTSGVAGLAIYRGRPGKAVPMLAGGFLGLMSGATLGGVAGMISCNGKDYCFTPVFTGAGGALVGLAVGLAAGARIAPERWEVVLDYPPRP